MLAKICFVALIAGLVGFMFTLLDRSSRPVQGAQLTGSHCNSHACMMAPVIPETVPGGSDTAVVMLR